MMAMRQIAGDCDDGDDEEGQDQDHGHDERGANNAQDPTKSTRRRRERQRKGSEN